MKVLLLMIVVGTLVAGITGLVSGYVGEGIDLVSIGGVNTNALGVAFDGAHALGDAVANVDIAECSVKAMSVLGAGAAVGTGAIGGLVLAKRRKKKQKGEWDTKEDNQHGSKYRKWRNSIGITLSLLILGGILGVLISLIPSIGGNAVAWSGMAGAAVMIVGWGVVGVFNCFDGCAPIANFALCKRYEGEERGRRSGVTYLDARPGYSGRNDDMRPTNDGYSGYPTRPSQTRRRLFVSSDLVSSTRVPAPLQRLMDEIQRAKARHELSLQAKTCSS